jgi:hypothetical protein
MDFKYGDEAESVGGEPRTWFRLIDHPAPSTPSTKANSRASSALPASIEGKTAHTST